MPPTRTVTVATSTAQNDAGVFELSFRDERYMPFEGLGAISQWQLTLPTVFRQFDYETINDVIISISYTSEQDGVLRAQVEAQNSQLQQNILVYFQNNTAKRLLSLRQDFSSAFTRLLRSPPVSTSVTIDLSDRNFPIFLRGRKLNVAANSALVLRTAPMVPGANPPPWTGLQITLDSTAGSPGTTLSFASDTSFDGLPYARLPNGFAVTDPLAGKVTHTLTIANAGGLGPNPRAPGDVSAVDPEQLRDILLYIEYTLTV